MQTEVIKEEKTQFPSEESRGDMWRAGRKTTWTESWRQGEEGGTAQSFSCSSEVSSTPCTSFQLDSPQESVYFSQEVMWMDTQPLNQNIPT